MWLYVWNGDKMINRVSARIVRMLGFRNRLKWLDDKKYLEFVFYDQLGYRLNLDNPKTFNEKMQWLKLYNRQPVYTTLVDKYAVKDYVARAIGKEHVISTIGVWDSAAEIDYSKLPNKFVMKCTHDSGCVVICKDKNFFNIAEAVSRLDSRKRKNFYYGGREWPYKNVRPRIIVEEYIQSDLCDDLRDYKLFCFNGKAKFFKVDFDRFVDHHANYYDIKGNILDFGEASFPPKTDRNIVLPSTIDLMIEYAERLSENIPFVRVDFYDVNGNVYFGEMTFFPASGFGHFIPEIADEKLGSMLVLPNKF